MLDISIITACLVLGADPALVGAVIDHESNWKQTAFNVNGWTGEDHSSDDLADAIAAAEVFVKNGYSVDIGVMQVNSNNLQVFGKSVAEAFDVCSNVQMGEAILIEGIDRAVKNGAQGDDAIKIGLSYYNTGDPKRGFRNGYVDTVWNNYTDDLDVSSRVSSTEITWDTSGGLFDYSDNTLLDFNDASDLSKETIR